MTVQRILDTQLSPERAFVKPDAKIREALNVLADNNVGALIVSTDGDQVVGIISERDIVRGLQKAGDGLLEKPVRDLMTEKVVTCVATDRAASIMATMVAKHMRHMPVLADGKFVSMISIRDLLQLRLNEVQSEADAMRSYIAGNG
ncbi:MAG: CBS domain-containing protein [Pseudomonadota bacterium]